MKNKKSTILTTIAAALTLVYAAASQATPIDPQHGTDLTAEQLKRANVNPHMQCLDFPNDCWPSEASEKSDNDSGER